MKRGGYGLALAAALLTFLTPGFSYADSRKSDFRSVAVGSWPYAALGRLEARGLQTGYAGGSFDGKSAHIRYEFAAALARMLTQTDQLLAMQSQDGCLGVMGPTPPRRGVVLLIPSEFGVETALKQGLRHGDIGDLRRLVREFAPELQRRGLNSTQRQLSLRLLARRMARLENRHWGRRLVARDRTRQSPIRRGTAVSLALAETFSLWLRHQPPRRWKARELPHDHQIHPRVAAGRKLLFYL